VSKGADPETSPTSGGREKESVGVILGCLVLDGINVGVWLAYTCAQCVWLLCDGISSLSRKGKVWRRPKSPATKQPRNPVRHLALVPTMDKTRAPYSGPSRKLAVAFDIGTTFSGAAYVFLDPGEVPIIRSVTKQVFPQIPDLVTIGYERDTDTSTIRILGLRKSPLYCITIKKAISVALRMGLISRMTMSCSG
jgi:hypothetical protein